ncbi:hypothetical protein [Streptomyces sp. WAC 06783]|uniref:hypothetical protein n=1 Tax=Streptomyces sp. WAC 06783 TaxID=2203211 RepID=UPI0021ADA001|nr:hypothetical protein [Streptomyces sp. WAC 06783]
MRWGFAALLPLELVLVLCVAGGVRIPAAAWPAVELAVPVLMITAAVLLALDYGRHRRDGLDHRSAVAAALADTVPAAVRKLTAHELFLSTSFLRWVTHRGPHGIHAGDLPAPYAPRQAAVTYGFLFDGSLRLRYGALLDIRIPADRIASVRLDRQFPSDKLAAVKRKRRHRHGRSRPDDHHRRIHRARPLHTSLGKPTEARTFRFYADDAAPVVAALRVVRSEGGLRPQAGRR